MHDLNCHHPKPRFSRGDYEAIADGLNRAVRVWGLEAVRHAGRIEESVMLDIMDSLTDMFTADNHLFDKGKFYARVYDNG